MSTEMLSGSQSPAPRALSKRHVTLLGFSCLLLPSRLQINPLPFEASLKEPSAHVRADSRPGSPLLTLLVLMIESGRLSPGAPAWPRSWTNRARADGTKPGWEAVSSGQGDNGRGLGAGDPGA